MRPDDAPDHVCTLVTITWKSTGTKETVCKDTLDRFIMQYGRPTAFTIEEEPKS